MTTLYLNVSCLKQFVGSKTRFRASIAPALIAAYLFFPLQSNQAAFVLEPSAPITSARFARLAVSHDGQEILTSWSELNTVDYRASHDGGLSFGPVRTAVEAPVSAVEGLWFHIESGTVPVLSADGTTAHIMAGVEIQTDPFFPPPPLPPALRASVMGLYSSTDVDTGFRKTQGITYLSNGCALRNGLRCSSLREFDMVTDDSGQVLLAVWNAFGFDGQEGETWFARGREGRFIFHRLVNLSETVLASSAGNDFDPRIATSASGNKIFISWEEVPPVGSFRVNLTHSSNGGLTWSEAFTLENAFSADLDYARSAERLALVYNTGFYFIDPLDPSRVEVRMSGNNGTTFGPPTIVATKFDLPDGSTVQVTGPVRVAVSRDSEVIAVLHAEERCDPIFGCLGGSVEPFDIVLSVSEDGGTSYTRTGVVTRTHFTSFQPYDLAVREDGQIIFVISNSNTGDTIFRRAVRQE